MFAKSQILLGKTRLYYPIKEKNKTTKTVQLIQNKIITGYRRLSQIITDIKISLQAKCN